MARSHLGLEAFRQLFGGLAFRVANLKRIDLKYSCVCGYQYLRDIHFHEHLRGKLLQTTDVDWALRGYHVGRAASHLLRCEEVAASHAQVAGGAHHAARETKRVIAEDGLGCAVVILVAMRGG